MPESMVVFLVVRRGGGCHLLIFLIHDRFFSALVVASDVLGEVLLGRICLQLLPLETLESGPEFVDGFRLSRFLRLGLHLEVRQELSFLLCIRNVMQKNGDRGTYSICTDALLVPRPIHLSHG